ncbi:hypothetical protein ACFFYR_21505 [Paraburkholderia dipogonis]|uniref:hypothetical protein n=1 Tax=Paraburkholderia dipogonis TaxID=1211383 RepID=UPI0035E74EBD
MRTSSFTAGGIGVVSQSGGILGSLLSRAASRGIGHCPNWCRQATKLTSMWPIFVDYLVDDDATSVIALYMEGPAPS